MSLQNSIIAILYSKIYHYKIIVKNANPIKALFLSGNKFQNFLVFIAKVLAYNFADFIIVNSEYNKTTISNFIINNHRVIKIYNPIDLVKFKKKIRKKIMFCMSEE